jgi:hypothetical protein
MYLLHNDLIVINSECHILFNVYRLHKCLCSAGLLLGLFFDPEDEGDMFLRNVG